MCPFCHSHFESQKMAFQCEKMKKGGTIKGIYDDIFKNDVTIEIMETLIKIEELREKLETSKVNEKKMLPRGPGAQGVSLSAAKTPNQYDMLS